jgi:macrolide-specific efflux system membrane fusion protein
VAETDLPNIKVGQAASVTLDALPGQTFTGQVSSISASPTVTQGVVTYAVVVSLSDLPATGGPVPGMTATAEITTESHSNVLILSSRAIQRVGTRQVVTVMNNGKQTTQSVTTGLTSGTNTEIDSGLQQGDVVVIPVTTTSASTTTGTNSTTGGFPGGGGNFTGGGGNFTRGGGQVP